MIHSVLPALALAVSLGLGPVAAKASVERPGPAPAQVQTLEARPSDAELTNFVAAFVRLMGVQHGYMMLLQHEEDPTRVEELKEQAVADMEAAIEQDGMSVDRYNTIALAIRDDPQLQNRVEGIIDQLAEDPSAPE